MSQPEKDQKTSVQTSASMTAMGLAGQIGCLVPAIILAAVLGGVWLDRKFDTEHIFTLILLLASIPITIFLTFQMAMRAVKNINQAIRPTRKDTPAEPDEEKPGE